MWKSKKKKKGKRNESTRKCVLWLGNLNLNEWHTVNLEYIYVRNTQKHIHINKSKQTRVLCTHLHIDYIEMVAVEQTNGQRCALCLRVRKRWKITEKRIKHCCCTLISTVCLILHSVPYTEHEFFGNLWFYNELWTWWEFKSNCLTAKTQTIKLKRFLFTKRFAFFVARCCCCCIFVFLLIVLRFGN